MLTRGDVSRSSYGVRGLRHATEIIVDRWGVSHLYGKTKDDVFRTQGFNVARERLWQIDYWRRRGLGRLSEIFGASHVDRDRAARLFLYRGSMADEWLAYGDSVHAVCSAFVEGVNSFVQLTRQDPDLLPREFTEIGYEPSFWDVDDVVRIRSHGLSYNLREEVARALTLRDFGADVEDLRRRREPNRPLQVPVGLDLSLIPDDVLAVYELATTPPVFAPGLDPDPTAGSAEGSNNWVLSGQRTASGQPLLASDPHRALGFPSLRYITHLSAPGFEVIGGGEPALPGVSIGHNGRVAFGLTIFPADQEDLYVYETNPGNPLEYRYQERWEPMRVEEEAIEVRGAEPQNVRLLFTRHGPVIYTEPERYTAFAVRAAWLEPGMAPYLGSLSYLGAGSTRDFRASLSQWGAPAVNQVYADTDGNIGWQACGLTPVRPNWDGTLPVPGDGRYEWGHFRDVDVLPGAENPEQGWLATANEMNLPPGLPQDRTVTYDWEPPFRHDRLTDVLSSTQQATAPATVQLQNDVVSVVATRIIRRVRELDVSDVDGLDLLVAWDGDLGSDSVAGALFETWYRRHLRPRLLATALEQLLPQDQRASALRRIAPGTDPAGDARVVLDLLEHPEGRLGVDPERVLESIVRDTMATAVTDLTEKLGPDRRKWLWGRLHQACLTHPLAPLLTSLPEDQLTTGPLPRGGSNDTVANTAYGPDLQQTTGATFRLVVDVSNWDGSLAMNCPGQSGRLGNRHAKDLVEPWLAGAAFPLLFTRNAVEAAAEQVITLEPL